MNRRQYICFGPYTSYFIEFSPIKPAAFIKHHVTYLLFFQFAKILFSHVLVNLAVFGQAFKIPFDEFIKSLAAFICIGTTHGDIVYLPGKHISLAYFEHFALYHVYIVPGAGNYNVNGRTLHIFEVWVYNEFSINFGYPHF